MNPVIEALLTRRSIRAFTSQPIEKEQLEQIARCAVFAPSARNQQTWQFTVTDNRNTIDRLAKAVGAAADMGPDYNFYEPAAVIIVSNQRHNPHGCADCSCALENIFLAAHSLGIGSVWINQLNTTCDTPAVRKQLTELGIPIEHVVYGMAALGYPADTARKPNKNMAAIHFAP